MTHDGREVAWPDGRTWVITFFYGHCYTACPALLAQLAAVRAQFQPAERKGMAFAAITFDPENDKPELLASLADEFKLSGPEGAVLTGDAATIARVVETFDFSYRPDGEGGFDHANLLAVMGGNGKILAHYYGIGGDGAKIAAKVRRLLARS